MQRRPLLRPVLRILTVQLALYLGCALLMLQRHVLGPSDIFGRLLAFDLPALLALGASGVAGWALAKRGHTALSVLRRVESAPRSCAFVAALLCALLSLWAMGARPLAMDEIAPLYQARVFAHGQLYATVAPDAVRWLFFRAFITGFFTVDLSLGHVVSFYWPGFALAMAPLEALGAGFLLNPLLAGGSMLLIRKVALALGAGSREVAGTAMLLLLAAPAFAINAATYYAMNAHLFANLAFVALVLRPTPRRLVAAGLVGAWALSLHNPFPHFVFALPWLLAQLCSRDRWKRVAYLALGYAPLGLVLVVGWHFYRNGFLLPRHGVPAISTERLLAFGFELPTLMTLQNRLLGMGKLLAWSSFGLVPLAVLGALRHWQSGPTKLLTASALLTLLAYLVTPYSQGHGWGYRYFHPALMTLPLLASLALSSGSSELEPQARVEADELRMANLWWMLGGLLVCLPLRTLQVRDFMQAHYGQRADVGRPDEQCVHFMKTGFGETFVQDLIWNDPWLRGRDLYLNSWGPRDARLMQELLPLASLRGETSTDVTYCAPTLDPLRARFLAPVTVTR